MAKLRDQDGKPVRGEARDPVEELGGLSRRDLLKSAAGAALAVAGVLADRRDAAGQLPIVLPTNRLNFLDRKQYIKNMEIHAEAPNMGSALLIQMWAKGAQRMLFHGDKVIDVTDPRKPTLVSKGKYRGGAHQLAYAPHLKKWILISGSTPPFTAPRHPGMPRGKYNGLGWKGDDAHPPTEITPEGKAAVEAALNFKGLRGIRTYDVTDPTNINLLQEYQTGTDKGGGASSPYYDGGKYAYLECAPDETFTNLECSERMWAYGIMVVDVSDPAKVQEVSRWWVPGMRKDEEEAYKKWPFAGDQNAWTMFHGPLYVPKRVEDGGDVGYGPWGHFGMLVHDFTDIRHPKLWGKVDPSSPEGGIPFHTTMPLVTRPGETRNQSLVLTTSETLEPDCGHSFLPQYVIDVKDKRHPRIIGRFPRPVPDPAAPYSDFCQARGRFGSHELTAFNAPGYAPYNFVPMTYQIAGLRIFDIADATDPKEVGYFVSPRTGELSDWDSWRTGGLSALFVEYDRNLIWATPLEGAGSLYCLSTPLLGKPILEPRKVTNWTMSHINAGWDDQTAKSVYFGRSLSQMVSLT